MSEPQTLLPCPFCGQKPKITKHFMDDIHRLFHRCRVVGFLEIGWHGTAEELATAWNRRSPDPRDDLLKQAKRGLEPDDLARMAEGLAASKDPALLGYVSVLRFMEKYQRAMLAAIDAWEAGR